MRGSKLSVYFDTNPGVECISTLDRNIVAWANAIDNVLADLTKEGRKMLWTILVILLILWLLGFIGHIGGSLIHLLLVIAVIVLIINLVSGRRAI